jgi:hypothetical protein
MSDRDERLSPRVVRALLTLIALDCLLLGPLWIRTGGLGPHQIALEAVFIVGLFLALPRARWSTGLAAAISALALLASFVGLADTAMRTSLARPLNLYLDLQLADSVVHLLQGTLGAVRGPLLLSLAGLVFLGIGAGLAWALAGLTRRPGSSNPRLRTFAPGVALCAVGALAVPLRWSHPAGVALALPSLQTAVEQGRQWQQMRQEMAAFRAELERPEPTTTPDAPPLQQLAGRDVVLAFIESYGMSALIDPRYAPIVQPRLDQLADVLDEAGLHLVTGQLEAPSQGGMSWLGHGSVLSGLWLDSQPRYDLLMASDRTTLVDDFEAAGHHTAAVMPAITLAWPEGVRLGYDELRVHAAIDYAGPPLNWVTMPDQYTWSFLERAVRHRDDGRPVFAELGLISSHAPWTPILEVIDDWSLIDDGRVFQRWANAGEPPEELWKDTDRVREHYALSLAYALETLTSWAARYADDDLLLIALGDHQPAPLITGDDAPRTVPVHVIARDPELLRPFLDWGFREGHDPTGTPERRMSAFREWFVRAYSQTATVAATDDS